MPKGNAFARPAQSDDGFSFKLPQNISGGRGRIESGDDYIGRLVDIVAEESKSSGNPMWTWTFVITKGEHAGREFKMWTVLTDDAAWKIVETLKAFGEDPEPGDEININRKQLIGTFVRLNVIDDTYNGADTSKLQGVLAHPKGAGYKGVGGRAVSEDDDETTPIDGGPKRNGKAPAEEEEPPRRAASKGGKAPVTSLKGGKKR